MATVVALMSFARALGPEGDCPKMGTTCRPQILGSDSTELNIVRDLYPYPCVSRAYCLHGQQTPLLSGSTLETFSKDEYWDAGHQALRCSSWIMVLAEGIPWCFETMAIRKRAQRLYGDLERNAGIIKAYVPFQVLQWSDALWIQPGNF